MANTWYAVRTQSVLIRPDTETRDEADRRGENGRFIPIPKVRGEIAAEIDLRAMGINAVCPIRVDLERRGKDRKPQPYESPYLRGYIFAQIPSDKFARAIAVKGVSSDLLTVQRGEVAGLLKFIERAEAERQEAHCIHKGGDLAAIHGFKAGQAIELLGDAFLDQFATFKRILKGASDAVPQVEFDIEMFGRKVQGRASLNDVRKVG